MGWNDLFRFRPFGGSYRPSPKAAPASDLFASLQAGKILGQGRRFQILRRVVHRIPEIDFRLIGELAEVFFSSIVDLPSSESHHHSVPWGLLDHSLEVADYALLEAGSEPFVTSTEAYPEVQHYRLPRLRLAAWVFGLLHDAGKAMSVVIQGPASTKWNPYEEPLADFYRRHGREACSLSWRPGRGLHGHFKHTPYFAGRLIPREILRFLGPRVIEDFVGQKSHAGELLGKLIEEADHRSTREDLARRHREAQERVEREDTSPIPMSFVDYVPHVPRILVRGILSGALSPDSEVFLGANTILLKYPESVERLGLLVRSEIGGLCINTRRLDGTELAAKILANELHIQRKLLYDEATDTWKLKAQVERLDGSFEVIPVIGLPLAVLGNEATRLSGLQRYPRRIEVRRALDDAPFSMEDFKGDEHSRSVGDRTKVASPIPVEHPPAPVEKHASIPGAPAPRTFLTGPVLKADLVSAIRARWIVTNQWGGQVYVLEETTYLIVPKVFEALFRKGIHCINPKKELRRYLEALSSLACVRKVEGKLLRRVVLRPEARPCWALAFDTKGFFEDPDLLGAIGTWAGSQIREITEAEHKAILNTRFPVNPPSQATGDALAL